MLTFNAHQHLPVVIVGEGGGRQAGWQYVSLKHKEIDPMSCSPIIDYVISPTPAPFLVALPIFRNLKLEFLTKPEDGEVIIDIV